jgi:cytochrome c
MRFTFVLLFASILLLQSCSQEKPKILVFSKTKGYRHESIKAGKAALLKMGAEKGFDVDTTEVADVFVEDSLKKYKAVVFLSTTGDVLNQFQQNEFMRFIQAGGGYFGIHAAADTEYDWWWYGKLVGAYFLSHPEQQEAKFKKVKDFGKGLELPSEWVRKDELYNYKKISPDINVLFKLDETSYKGGENGENHPIAWYHDFDGGRSFYTGMGHTNESYVDPMYLDHVYQGLLYAMGDKKLDWSKAKAKHVPEENRFTKVVLGFNFDEPTEMDILPDGRIMFLERKGAIKMYDPKTDSIKKINTFNIWTKFEDGMLGLAHDPDFETNKFMYIYYSHPEKSANVLSRFVFDGNKIDQSTEKILLEVGTQRETCCHTGGSIVFDKNKNLYVSTGDNTSPFESDGFSPSDEGAGRSPFDAQKSSGNTNDLRGKILRIHPEADGTYTIPEGNLFPKGEANTRPEIYVMGNRNPYRISVDQRTGFLYWGEVGPDAGENKDGRGPRGYDEINQARKAGYFGWPYFVGGNYAYNEYDFQQKSSGSAHDPLKPINNSPNNTGKKDLPPVSPPFIWYPYTDSPDFPLVKKGGRNAMAGPVYYSEDFKGKDGAFPDYFDGKLIGYDWMRNWMRLITMNEQGDIMDIEPFMDNTTFNNMSDMAFGPDGKLYILEYGTAWFKQNMDARLSRIDFNRDNRLPVAKLKVDKLSGAIPLAVKFSAKETVDPDGDKITYELAYNDQVLKSETGDFDVTFDKAGIYRTKLNVVDAKGSKSSDEVVIVAGNEPPTVKIDVEGNSMFYLAGGSTSYSVSVEDKEDGSTDDGKIKAERVNVTVDFQPQGYDKTKIAQGHQRAELPGKLLIAESDCKSCHMIDQKSAGPAYRDVAKKYKTETRAIEMLADKILKGGSGVWGEVAMAAHPQLTKDQASQMVEYILTLANEKKAQSLPLKGATKFAAAPAAGVNPQSAYIITASYEDNGASGMPSLNNGSTLVLRAPVIGGGDANELSGGARKMASPTGGFVLENVKHNSVATYSDIDFTGVGKLSFTVAEVTLMTKGGKLEAYLDSKDGKKLGVVDFEKSPKINVQAGVNVRPGSIPVSGINGKHNLVLVFINADAGDSNLYYFAQITLEK